MSDVPRDSFLIIIGAMKSGTTTLYDLLCEHPEICACASKEPEFFSENQAHSQAGPARYEELWDYDSARHRFALEASTGYTKRPEEQGVASRMQQYGIHPRLIYIVRDPFERIESDYDFSRANAWFDPAVDITDERYTAFSNYYLQLQDYVETFGRERLTILDFAALKSDPERLLAELCETLGLSAFEFSNPSRISLPSRRRSRRERLLAKSSWLRAIAGWAPARAKGLFNPGPAGSAASDRRLLSPAEKTRVLDEIGDDLRKFAADYDFPVEQWGVLD